MLSNFGVMFFDDPAAAFGNLRKALRRDGRLAFLCWRTRDENPSFTIGFTEVAAVPGLREMPGPDAAFSLADTGRAQTITTAARRRASLFTVAASARELEKLLEQVLTTPASKPSGRDWPTQVCERVLARFQELRFAPEALSGSRID